MTYELSFAPERIQLDLVHRWLASSYWSPGIRLDVVKSAVANSLVLGAYDTTSGTQVGFARVVTDQATFAWVCDVVVVEERRGEGIAQAMMHKLLHHPRLQTLRRWCLATRDAHGLYEKFGFALVPADCWMQMTPPQGQWTETASST